MRVIPIHVANYCVALSWFGAQVVLWRKCPTCMWRVLRPFHIQVGYSHRRYTSESANPYTKYFTAHITTLLYTGDFIAHQPRNKYIVWNCLLFGCIENACRFECSWAVEFVGVGVCGVRRRVKAAVCPLRSSGAYGFRRHGERSHGTGHDDRVVYCDLLVPGYRWR